MWNIANAYYSFVFIFYKQKVTVVEDDVEEAKGGNSWWKVAEGGGRRQKVMEGGRRWQKGVEGGGRG